MVTKKDVEEMSINSNDSENESAESANWEGIATALATDLVELSESVRLILANSSFKYGIIEEVRLVEAMTAEIIATYKKVEDEQKEELDARVQQAKREIGEHELDENATKENIRKLYKSKQHSNRYTSSAHKGYILKMALIIMILSAIAYKLIQSDALTFILKGLTK